MKLKKVKLSKAKLSKLRDRLLLQEDLNFLLTNRVPRVLLTRVMGRFSKIRQPIVRGVSLAVWRMFTDLDLSETTKRKFDSVHDCFIRELKPGARPVDQDPSILTSPCDAIVGQCGRVHNSTVYQAKGFPYLLSDLLGTGEELSSLEGGFYVTLRLRSNMYHRFHAPYQCRVRRVTYFSGDTWNVNPIALKRVERLFCKNERACIRCEVESDGATIHLVAVAAVLVASIRLHCLEHKLHLRYRGPNEIDCDALFEKGEEMGWFEHGSTILVFVPPGYQLMPGIGEGSHIRMGRPLLVRTNESGENGSHNGGHE